MFYMALVQEDRYINVEDADDNEIRKYKKEQKEQLKNSRINHEVPTHLQPRHVIKLLQSCLAKPVTHQTHTKLSPISVSVIPVSSKPVSYKQLTQTVKQSRPDRISKPIVQVPQRPPASPTATPSPFKSLESLAPMHTPLQAHHIQWSRSYSW